MTQSSAHSVASNEFVSFVDRLAARLVEHSPTFEAFVVAMPGVMPDEALAALRRIPGPHAERLITDAQVDRAGPAIDQCSQLPLPHPLDSEFRFDDATAEILANALVEGTADGDELLLIGVPTVAVTFAHMNIDRRVRFLGPDNCVTAAVRNAFGDDRLSLDQGEGGSAAAAVIDPPWYREPMAELLGVASYGCRAGALIKVMMPPIGTRPQIAIDREAFFDFAANVGLKPTGFNGPVCYRTPLFELATMERQGISRLPNWRRGEAVEFVASSQSPPVRWRSPNAVELTVGGVRLRAVRGGSAAAAALSAIGDHEVFPSISARAPGRSAVTLWTSTNRAFLVDFDAILGALGAINELGADPELLQSGFYHPYNRVSHSLGIATGGELIHQVGALIGRELDDARRLVGDGSWLKTTMEWRY